MIDTARRFIGFLSPRRYSTSFSNRESDALFRAYGQLARAQGFDRLYVLLSFDCDTPEDIGAAEQLDMWLRARGIARTYAVPGAMLQQGASVYRVLADAGAEFINHGERPHTEWRDGRYWSVTFYHEMTRAEIQQDIREGDRIFREVLGRAPFGFRAPHFGNFQQSEQRAIIYDTIRELGYHFSSSTLHSFAFDYGVLFNVGDLYEIPLSSSFAQPQRLFDSWSYIESPYHPVVTNEYADLFIQTVDRLLALRVPGVLNYYVDPAHVQPSRAFFRSIEHLLKRQVPTIQFEQLLEISTRKKAQ